MAETRADLMAQGGDPTTTLCELEKRDLEQYEQVIRKGLNTFLAVGHALADIRDRRLYRETHTSFEKYCKDVWDLSKGYATQQIKGYQTVNLLESKLVAIATEKDAEGMDQLTDDKWASFDHCLSCEHRKSMANRAFKGIKIIGAPGKCTRPGGFCDKVQAAGSPDTPREIILPVNEAQTRPLTKLKNPDDQVKAWQIVLEKLNQDPKTKLTAALINKAVKEVKGEVVQRKINEIQQKIPLTDLLSRQFKNQHQVLLDIVVAAKNEGWVNDKRSEVIKYLKALVAIAESDD